MKTQGRAQQGRGEGVGACVGDGEQWAKPRTLSEPLFLHP